MAAGLGFKTFTTGEVLTAADTNGYLMQGINVFASTAARDAAITSPQEGQFAFTKDTNGLWYYDGAAWVASGATGDIEGVTAGVGITGGGTSGTVTITNDMATTITAAGDIVVGTGSGTYDNLPIGTTAQVLTADTTVSPYKVKWATPAASSSAMVFITSSTFSNVATVSVEGCFTSTYDQYVLTLTNCFAATGSDDAQFGFKYGTTLQASGYYGSYAYINPSTSLWVIGSQRSDTKQIMSTSASANTEKASGQINIAGVGVSTTYPTISGNYNNLTTESASFFSGGVASSNTMTGFLLNSSSSNISGTVRVYGLAKS